MSLPQDLSPAAFLAWWRRLHHAGLSPHVSSDTTASLEAGVGCPDRTWSFDLPDAPAAIETGSLEAVTQQTGPVPRRYFLTSKAARGLLRREYHKPMALSAALRTALERLAQAKETL